VADAYAAYSTGRRTLADLSQATGLSLRAWQRKLDAYAPAAPAGGIPATPVALTFDATFFGRGYGVLVYRALGKNIHWQEIVSERLQDMADGLRHLLTQGWQFSSVTIDGRKGTVLLIDRLLPGVPVQMCP
jgi:hypothetical protein